MMVLSAALAAGVTGALLGGWLLSRPADQRPWWLVLVHVAVLIGCMGLLGISIASAPVVLPRNTGMLLLGVALLGGAFNGLFRLQGEAPPGLTIYLHAIAGIIALILLAIAWYGS